MTLRERWTLASVFATMLALKWGSLSNPFYWDEAGAYMPPSIFAAREGLWRALPGMHAEGDFAGHPPLLYLVHGIIFRLAGGSIAPHHLVSLLFAFLGVVYTYRLAAHLVDQRTGICAAALLFFSSIFFTQSTMVLGDMPIAALGVMAVYFLVRERPVAYAVAATALLQTKETALAVAVAAAVWWALTVARRHPRRVSWWMHAVPIGSLLLFFILERVRTGAFIQIATVDHPTDILTFRTLDPAALSVALLDAAVRIGRFMFLAEGRFVATAFILAALIGTRRRELRRIVLPAAIVLLYCAAFLLLGSLPRYLLPAFPHLAVVCAAAISSLVGTVSGAEAGRSRQRVLQFALTALAVAVGIPFYWCCSASGNFETNLQHQGVITATKEVVATIERDPSRPAVVTDWPMTRYLTMPELGYVESAVPIAGDHSQGAHEIFVFSSIAPSPRSLEWRAHARREGLRLVTRVANDEVFYEVYAWR